MAISGVQPATNERPTARTAASSGTGGADFGAALEAASAKDKTEPVAGRGYAKIVDGPNKGLYVNTTGNARDGKLFKLEPHGAHEHHVYGEGDDRLVVGVTKSRPAAAPSPTAPVTTTPAPSGTPTATTPAAPLLTSPLVSGPTTPTVPLLPGPAAATDTDDAANADTSGTAEPIPVSDPSPTPSGVDTVAQQR